MLCDRFSGLNPFIIREQDATEVITLINRFIDYGSSKKSNADTKTNNNSAYQKTNRKRVYADTSTNGWY